MDKLAHLVGMDPMEFRILNAYRDGDMKAHRREAKNTALIECVQVAAEKAKWPIREEFRRMSSRAGGGGARAAIPHTPALDSRRGAGSAPVAAAHQPTTGRRSPPTPQPRVRSRRARRAAAARAAAAASPRRRPRRRQHGAARFSSVFGTRRR